ncbi:DUF378 domain-containing protein [Asaccharospora irregularis]|uniref:DUF378 domain-containing protein n=1 Tax=Asaccharospora irregularis DSM 2635 TaxID=1121321 RepID=A0A1M5QFJ7_9FIRM|nr:DUF378 domain-containing protein [Asaccharospora irregularis]SHH12718.1 hypothetical protein SAMN04488530_1212 [Asaccharospora irregularis DSM 2635]
MRKFALILAIIGALNWGGIGIFGIDLLGSIFGGTYQLISRVIYSIVGLAGIYLIPSLMSDDRK